MSGKQSKLNVLNLEKSPIPILEQLQLEEALLRSDEGSWCIINWGSRASAIVLGISGKVEQLIDKKKMEEAPLPLIRRCSGGGTVVIDGGTCFISFIFSSAHSKVKSCPQHIHAWAIDQYQQSLPGLPIKFMENDYAIGDKKYGGNAQYLCKERWLHHTCFLWDYNPLLMEYLLLPNKTPEYRLKRSHDAFLGKLCTHLTSREEFTAAVIRQLGRSFHIETSSLEMAKAVLMRPHRKATSFISWP